MAGDGAAAKSLRAYAKAQGQCGQGLAISACAVILNFNGADLSRAAAESVIGAVDQVILADNGSADADRRRLAHHAVELGAHSLEIETNLGYAAGNNRAIAAALELGHDSVLVVNSDALAEPGAVERLRTRLDADPRLACVSPVQMPMEGDHVLYSTIDVDVRTGSASFADSGTPIDQLSREPRTVDFLCGTGMLMRAEAVRELGGFDEDFVAYYEDIEWSARARAHSWRLEVVPGARFRHLVMGSTPPTVHAFYMARGRSLFLRKARRRSAVGAAVLTLPGAIERAVWWLRNGRQSVARAVIRGWLSGSGPMRPDRTRLPESPVA